MTEDKGPGNILPDDEAFEVLPWHVNETLPESEAEEVRSHVANCSRCQQEIATLTSLKHAIVTTNETAVATEPEMLSRVLNRIEDYEAGRARVSHDKSIVDAWRSRLSVFFLSWSRVAFAAQFAALLVLAVALVITTQRTRFFENLAASEKARADRGEQQLKETQQRDGTGYETLTGPNNTDVTNGARLTVVFQERAAEREIRELLNGINGSIVSGPSSQRMYVVVLPSSQGADRQRLVATALTQLRANAQTVQFAAEQP